MTSPEAVLTIENLHISLLAKEQQPRPIVRDVSLSVYPGRVTGLIGESGCGKSLTCLTVLGLLPQNVITSYSIHYTKLYD